ncbi:hypothetical protein QYE76_069197 [Lolium multiflorum]|uniref:Uncharacterized protein n=1 Tax=Lolium multiflorum TaxID=4521 RepID=A0AAD8WEP2_LOLMU|nr:hypothetical protein QYE76_069197 [Lolium multiflorum]
MDMWQMLDKFRAEVVDSSSDEESDQSTQTLATTAASMIHEFSSNQGAGAPGLCQEPLKKHAALMQGKPPRMSYEINGNEYDKPYYLAHGIYPDWATLVKTVRNPNSEKTRRFAKMQEACRKDVKREFGVLQAPWTIVHHPARTWSRKTIHEVMT